MPADRSCLFRKHLHDQSPSAGAPTTTMITVKFAHALSKPPCSSDSAKPWRFHFNSLLTQRAARVRVSFHPLITATTEFSSMPRQLAAAATNCGSCKHMLMMQGDENCTLAAC